MLKCLLIVVSFSYEHIESAESIAYYSIGSAGSTITRATISSKSSRLTTVSITGLYTSSSGFRGGKPVLHIEVLTHAMLVATHSSQCIRSA